MNRQFCNTVGSYKRIFCIGRNYAQHARELDSPIPESPVVFLKPLSCLVPLGEMIVFPSHGTLLHHETELVFLIGKGGRVSSVKTASSFILGITLGLDLTLRDLQSQLKKKGEPWEIAKGFDGSAPIGAWVPYDPKWYEKGIEFFCRVNGAVRQTGYSKDMIFPIAEILIYLSTIWHLQKGDLIYTGTPEGVGPISPGDEIVIESPSIGTFSWRVAPSERVGLL